MELLLVKGRLAGELTRLVPELAQRFPDLPAPLAADPDTERYRLFDAVAAWLAAVAAAYPPYTATLIAVWPLGLAWPGTPSE